MVHAHRTTLNKLVEVMLEKETLDAVEVTAILGPRPIDPTILRPEDAEHQSSPPRPAGPGYQTPLNSGWQSSSARLGESNLADRMSNTTRQ